MIRVAHERDGAIHVVLARDRVDMCAAIGVVGGLECVQYPSHPFERGGDAGVDTLNREVRRIIATPITHEEFEGLRVTPNVYTTLEEIDTFAGAMERKYLSSLVFIKSKFPCCVTFCICM